MLSSFGLMVGCTVTGAAVKKNCAAASTHSRATAFCDMHVNSNVPLILPRLGHYYEKQLARTIRQFLFVVLHGLTRTNLFFSCENSFGFYVHTLTSSPRSTSANLSESSSALFLKPSLSLLAVSERCSMG